MGKWCVKGGGGGEQQLVAAAAAASAMEVLRLATRYTNSPKKPRIQLLAVDHSARASMKNAASCEN